MNLAVFPFLPPPLALAPSPFSSAPPLLAHVLAQFTLLVHQLELFAALCYVCHTSELNTNLRVSYYKRILMVSVV